MRLKGHWESWLDFFFQGLRDIAERTASDIQQALALFEKDRIRISQMGRSARSCLLIHGRIKAQPMTSIAALSLATGLTPTTIATSLANLGNIGIVREITGGRYGRLYAYDGYLKILAPDLCRGWNSIEPGPSTNPIHHPRSCPTSAARKSNCSSASTASGRESPRFR